MLTGPGSFPASADYMKSTRPRGTLRMPGECVINTHSVIGSRTEHQGIHHVTDCRCRLILTYLIPCHLLTTHTLPSMQLLKPYPRLQRLFGSLGRCIKRGDLAGFDAALAAGEDEFVKRRIYLTLERGRDIALRNLLRKVYLSGGFEESKNGGGLVRRTRIPVVEFVAAIRLGNKAQSSRIDIDEVECLLANMIYKVCDVTYTLLVQCGSIFVFSSII